MELFGFNEYQWLTITICTAGIVFSIGKRIGISDTLDYLRDKDLIDYDD
tara:strand:+ start:573 stop:719 length:147 start_codon:yes stop_codon:yes gene_type:complete